MEKVEVSSILLEILPPVIMIKIKIEGGIYISFKVK